MGPASPTKAPRLAELPRLRSATYFGGQRQVPFHKHDAPELVYCQAGHLWIEVGGLTLEASPGFLFVLPGGVPHNQRCEGNWRTLCVLYLGGERVLETQPRLIALKGDTKFSTWLDDLCDLHATQNELADPVADALLLAILTRAAQHESRKRALDSLHPRVAQAITYLHTHSDREVTASELASASYASYSHLSALFRARFGCGPLKYHQTLRLDRAKRLLLNPYLGIAEIAEQLGFEDSNYFTRLFRKSCGLPPARWRKSTTARLLRDTQKKSERTASG